MADSLSLEFAVAVFGGANILSFVVKLAVLIWAYIRTHKPAAIGYIVFLFLNGLSPFLLSLVWGVSEYGLYTIFVNAGAAVLEAGLFVWLVRSLLKRPSTPFNDA